ncbi:MAG: PAS domain-containing protein, partial [Phycisphaerales bacterium]|nr:PAS domain-containing protein [Phycisphaerales bacterium]
SEAQNGQGCSNRLRRGAERFATGELNFRLPVAGSPDLANLADSLNRMAGQLDERLSHLANQRNELMAVLASMDEGVVAIDPEERVMSLNQAAIRLLNLDPLAVIGRSVVETVRNSTLQDLVRRTLEDEDPAQAELTVKTGPRLALGNDITTLQLVAHTSPLRDSQGRRIGVLLVIRDVTRLRQLETVRRDFVANVSHEVKTPVAAIKAAAETLRGILPEADSDAQRFMGMIVRQADRLNAVVDDLLNLARLEQDNQTRHISITPTLISEVFQPAVESTVATARDKRIGVKVICPTDLLAVVNAGLLEHAVVNLLDNAIKYSPEGSTVELEARSVEGELVITVVDQGMGIEPEHLPRIFERFYRVDKARSRALGGTGLGLAIVKHVAQAHDGRVSVESTPGKGSIFRLHLPMNCRNWTAWKLSPCMLAPPDACDLSCRSVPYNFAAIYCWHLWPGTPIRLFDWWYGPAPTWSYLRARWQQ